jgi:hypothetical protein
MIWLLAQTLGRRVQAVWSGHRPPHVAGALLALAANLHTACHVQKEEYHGGNDRNQNQWVHLYIQREKVASAIQSANKNKTKK